MEAVGFASTLPCAASAGVDGFLRVWDLNQTVERAVCEHPNVSARLLGKCAFLPARLCAWHGNFGDCVLRIRVGRHHSSGAGLPFCNSSCLGSFW